MANMSKNISGSNEKIEELLLDPKKLAIYVINRIQGKIEGVWMSYHDFLATAIEIANKEMSNCVIADSVLYGSEMLYKDGDFEIWRVARGYQISCDEIAFWFRVRYQAVAVDKKIRAICIENILD